MTYDDGFQEDDGGRSDVFRATNVDDCVVRAIAIVSGIEYKLVYDSLSRDMGVGQSPRNGVPKRICRGYLERIVGFEWHPTMFIGQGCQTHLRADEMPSGRLVVSLSRHLTAMIDGVIHDTRDPRRGGTRCVYGYWASP